MLAAENGGLPGGKVGGMGDVVRDLPRALASLGHRVSVLTPAYGFLARLPGVEQRAEISVPFGGHRESCAWLSAPSGHAGVDYQLLDHARFTPGGRETIYHDDDAAGPFATDANQFAFFCAAAAETVSRLEDMPDVVHLHDWHTGLFLLLRAVDPRYRALRSIRTVLSIHNLALQGIRPRAETDSCLARWFPDLEPPSDLVGDPRYPDCVNPLAIGIRLADAVSTVSPSYAQEILRPTDPQTGRHGGEGLERLLAGRHRDGALTGILNGCEYPEGRVAKPVFRSLVRLIERELSRWIAARRHVDAAAYLADKRAAAWHKRKPTSLATSVGRVTEQKLGLLIEPMASATTLDRILELLSDGCLIMLGNGDPNYEAFLQRTMAEHENFLFLKGYSDELADALYRAGDLFLMPSVFEPCGISQMLAMRAGQVCVAHAVGGLKDTVTPELGFPFAGETGSDQAEACVRAVATALELKATEPARWQAIRRAAKRARFDWEASARRYLAEVYGWSQDADAGR